MSSTSRSPTACRAAYRNSQRAHATVILDLSDLQFIDSTGLQLLIINFNDATHNGWHLRIDPHLTSEVRHVVELVGLAHTFWQ